MFSYYSHYIHVLLNICIRLYLGFTEEEFE